MARPMEKTTQYYATWNLQWKIVHRLGCCREVLWKVYEENLTLDQIYNCDTTGLNFKILPSKTLASQEEKVATGLKKIIRESYCAANDSCNHRLQLMVISKATKPWALKNLIKSTLPVTLHN